MNAQVVKQYVMPFYTQQMSNKTDSLITFKFMLVIMILHTCIISVVF